MVVWRRLRTVMAGVLAVALVVYLAYCTRELYTRIQNTRKHTRLIHYEKDIDELTGMVRSYKRDAARVQHSLHLLREAFDQLMANNNPRNLSHR